jgi:hypothetical protein
MMASEEQRNGATCSAVPQRLDLLIHLTNNLPYKRFDDSAPSLRLVVMHDVRGSVEPQYTPGRWLAEERRVIAFW